MKNNKAPGPDGIPIEFYKALFCNEKLEKDHPSAARCLKIIFNKFWNDSFRRGIFPQFRTQGQMLVVLQTKASMTHGRV